MATDDQRPPSDELSEAGTVSSDWALGLNSHKILCKGSNGIPHSHGAPHSASLSTYRGDSLPTYLLGPQMLSSLNP